MTDTTTSIATERVTVAGLSVDPLLYAFVRDEALPFSTLDSETFWAGVAGIVADLMPRNRELLQDRERLQRLLDEWHRRAVGETHDPTAYLAFLREIGYVEDQPSGFTISTTGVDPEIAELAGPQLIVPVLNARYALNAVNARWGSLYDALYGTDAITPEAPVATSGYDPLRGEVVVEFVTAFLDEHFPLSGASHGLVVGYRIVDGSLIADDRYGGSRRLVNARALRGWTGDAGAPTSFLLAHNGLHLEVCIDRDDRVGADHPAGVHDVLVEAALTTIVDLEDSVAAVNAADKVAAYRNWLGLNTGQLRESFHKDGLRVTRELRGDRRFSTPEGELVLPGRALMLVRNVGHLMTTDAVLDADGNEIGEGLLDAVVTTLTALPGLSTSNARGNSRTGSIYIVKPKMHSPAEVALTVELFSRVERLLNLPVDTIKLGLMDEERRMSVNLAAAMHQARTRLVFINTGFLDRSGDEIRSSTFAGPMVRKGDMKRQRWIAAYEQRNVQIGVLSGLVGRGQIGKGMWAMPDLMGEMLQQKKAQLEAGASTAWVPSPTAATLHALHYHAVSVRSRQSDLTFAAPAPLDELLTLPVGNPSTWSAQEIEEELNDNIQSLLGYVVRWIDQGIGCSKVPNLRGVALMEDRATLRISSQLLANWLEHNVITAEQVRDALRRMADVVDAQNAHDPQYEPMGPAHDDSEAFQAALELVVEGVQQPSGYTEPILHRWRKRRLERQGAQLA